MRSSPTTQFTVSNAGANFGLRVPDVVANLRVDQAWGLAGVSLALHDASGAYYGTANNVGNGHPEDSVRLGGRDGRKFNLPGGDIVGVNFAYGVGAPGFVANGSANAQMYNSSTSVGVGWLSDGVFTTGTAVELTRAWSITAAYEHVWSPRWRMSWYGGYANIDYNGAATGIINSALAFGSVCARPFAGLVGNSLGRHRARRQQLQSGLQLLSGRLPHPVEPGAETRYRLGRDLYGPQHRVQRRRRLCRERFTACGRPARRPGRMVGDVPLAAQLSIPDPERDRGIRPRDEPRDRRTTPRGPAHDPKSCAGNSQPTGAGRASHQ